MQSQSRHYGFKNGVLVETKIRVRLFSLEDLSKMAPGFPHFELPRGKSLFHSESPDTSDTACVRALPKISDQHNPPAVSWGRSHRQA